MSAPNSKSLRSLAWFTGVFSALALIVIALAVFDIVSFQLGLLMLVGLVGLFFGMAVLIVVYRFVAKLE
jgi:hypothetical protein